MTELAHEISRCRLCADRFAATHTAHDPRPVVWFRPSARLLIAGQELSVFDSRLLEVGLEAGAALATPRGEKLRLVGGRGLGQPMYFELDLGEPASQALPAGSPLLERDWPSLLALEFDLTGAVVPRQP